MLDFLDTSLQKAFTAQVYQQNDSTRSTSIMMGAVRWRAEFVLNS